MPAESNGTAGLCDQGGGLWTADHPETTFLGVRMGSRCTVLRLRDGGLWVHSPVPLTPTLQAEVAALGEVTHVVAPNLYHHLYVSDWLTCWPQARFYAHPRLTNKRADLPAALPLTQMPPDLAPVPIDGWMLGETVFLHNDGRTLITSDLFENFASSDDWYSRMYLKLAGLEHKAAVSLLIKPTFTDRKAARRSLDAVLSHPIERVMLAHGNIVPHDGQAICRAAFSWMT